jgi:pimeloyl-ACP methyl ester carboxylesterase
MLHILALLFIAVIAKADSPCAAFLNLDAQTQLAQIANQEIALGVPDEHRTHAYLYPHKTKISIVITHGLLNSPAWMQWIAKRAYDQGFNVINVRLPDHFEQNREATDAFDYHEAIAQGQRITQIAQQLGDKVIYIGHSVGADISIYSAINNPQTTAGLILFSPALRVTELVRYGSKWLSDIGISGWLADFLFPPDDEKDRYLSTYAGAQVTAMGDELAAEPAVDDAEFSGPYGLIRQRLNPVSMLWFDTAADKIIDIQNTAQVADSMPNVQHFVYPAELGIAHDHSFDEPTQDGSARSQILAEATARWTQFLTQH